MLFPGHTGACRRDTGHEIGIHIGWDVGLSQGNMLTHSHTECKQVEIHIDTG